MLTELDEIIKSMTKANLTEYQTFLTTWIFDLGHRNIDNFNYNNIKDMATLIYLLLKDLKVLPKENDTKIIEYINKHHGYGDLIHKMIIDLSDQNPDYFELLSQIQDTQYGNAYMSYADFTKKLETLYNTEKLSEEENRETLIFGDNILGGEMTVRELSDIVRMMTKDYVNDYIHNLNLGDITFELTENSIMFLKESEGILFAVVKTKGDVQKSVIRYTNEDGSALFLLFEPVEIKTETIYGLSLDSEKDEERGLLILEKDKDESLYKLLFGRGEW